VAEIIGNKVMGIFSDLVLGEKGRQPNNKEGLIKPVGNPAGNLKSASSSLNGTLVRNSRRAALLSSFGISFFDFLSKSGPSESGALRVRTMQVLQTVSGEYKHIRHASLLVSERVKGKRHTCKSTYAILVAGEIAVYSTALDGTSTCVIAIRRHRSEHSRGLGCCENHRFSSSTSAGSAPTSAEAVSIRRTATRRAKDGGLVI